MDQSEFCITVPGKIILSGEHAVVYGYPALLTAINRHLTLNEENEIHSTIPIGCGLGSSAAYSVATVTSCYLKRKLKPTIKTIYNQAYAMEKTFHGTSSGADPAICTFGGFLEYIKTSTTQNTLRFLNPKFTLPNLYLLNTGKPSETTKDMINFVADKYHHDPHRTNRIFRNISIITNNFVQILEKSNDLLLDDLINSVECYLEELGVISQSTQSLIHHIKTLGGSAKVTGAGGRQTASGMILIHHHNATILQKFLSTTHLDFFKVKLGQPGVSY